MTSLKNKREASQKALLKAASEEPPAGRGRALGRRHCAETEALLLEALGSVALPEKAAVAVVGGMACGCLALGSDVDLRILVPSLADVEALTQRVLYPLWDAGLRVDHQVVTPRLLIELGREDLPTATAVLDWRFLAGDQVFAAEAIKAAHTRLFQLSELPAFMGRLDAEAETRHGRFGASVYLLEPDVKNGRGGLRDMAICRWASRARWGVSDYDGLIRLGVLVPRQLQAVERARELLWRIRNGLHARASGRRRDRLNYDAQEELGQSLDFGDEPGEAAERLMREYYRAARTIERFRDMIVARATPDLRSKKRVATTLSHGLQLFDGEMTLVERSSLRSDPAVALRLVEGAVKHGVPLRPSIRNAIVDVAGDPAWCAKLRESEEAAGLFVALVMDCRETKLKRSTTMRELHDVGLLLAMIPEFGPLVGRVHHDTYHVYTVDVHSVAAVDRLAEIVRGDILIDDDEGDHWGGALACRLGAEVTGSKVLFVATLLHDVGKAIGRRDHSERGAEMAQTILRRLGFDREAIDRVAGLILNHLTMYLMATRRDVGDPATAEELVRLVGDRQGLEHLYLLTVADLSTTSPKSMTSWKARMLDDLYLVAAQRLKEDGDAGRGTLAAQRAAVLTLAQARRSCVNGEGDTDSNDTAQSELLAAFVQSAHARYLAVTPPADVLAHAQHVQALVDGTPVVVALESSQPTGAVDACVVAPDRPGLLAAIADAMSRRKLHIQAAQIHVCDLPKGYLPRGSRGVAIDRFSLTTKHQRARLDESLAAVARDLAAWLGGEVVTPSAQVATAQLGSTASRGPKARRRSRVVLDNRSSRRFTVVEVITSDRPGLLHALAGGLHALGFSISYAKIATEGQRVVDVFYIDKDGKKLDPRTDGVRLRKAVLTWLGEAPTGTRHPSVP